MISSGSVSGTWETSSVCCWVGAPPRLFPSRCKVSWLAGWSIQQERSGLQKTTETSIFLIEALHDSWTVWKGKESRVIYLCPLCGWLPVISVALLVCIPSPTLYASVQTHIASKQAEKNTEVRYFFYRVHEHECGCVGLYLTRLTWALCVMSSRCCGVRFSVASTSSFSHGSLIPGPSMHIDRHICSLIFRPRHECLFWFDWLTI